MRKVSPRGRPASPSIAPVSRSSPKSNADVDSESRRLAQTSRRSSRSPFSFGPNSPYAPLSRRSDEHRRQATGAFHKHRQASSIRPGGLLGASQLPPPRADQSRRAQPCGTSRLELAQSCPTDFPLSPQYRLTVSASILSYSAWVPANLMKMASRLESIAAT